MVAYWAGPVITDAAAKQMADGGWNVVWCSSEKELDVAHRHGLRALFQHPLIAPASLDNPKEREKLDALVARVRKHPALYWYFIKDEPGTQDFPDLARIVTYLREQDPSHLAYINLFPTYAQNQQLGKDEKNQQLGVKGDKIPAYQDYLRKYLKIVKPALLSYDHYQFYIATDSADYFLNLAMIRQTALDNGLPFLNIVQAASWDPGVRVPTGNEMRYLVYTTLAYGAEGISYYVYCCPGHKGGIANPDGTPTPIYQALKPANHEFVAIAKELQLLKSLAVYHAGMLPPGCVALPDNAPFRFDPPVPKTNFVAQKPTKGMLLGYFGQPGKNGENGKTVKPTHVLAVNLDYTVDSVVTLAGPGRLETFDATAGKWTPVGGDRLKLQLPPGGGRLIRCQTQ